jgi:hypothetical protein
MLEALDRIYTWWVWVHIKLNSYKVASVITASMALGIAFDHRSILFDMTAKRYFILTPAGWCIWFLVATVLLWRLRSGRWEFPTTFAFFMMPMTLFYGTLFELTLSTPRPSILILILVVAALFTTIYSVTRYAAFSFYRDSYSKVLEENTRLRARCGESGVIPPSGDGQVEP